MTPDQPDTPTIRPATAASRVQALWLVFSAFPAEERASRVAATVTAAADPETTFADLLITCRDKRIVAAAWLQPAPGRIAIVWPPQLIEGEPEATATALFQQLEARLVAGDVDLAHSIQPSLESEASHRLRRQGFQMAAKLLFLTCDVGPSAGVAEPAWDGSPGGPGEEPLDFEPFEEVKADRLFSLIERTYVETQDIPLLNDLRSLTDVLDGYRHAGAYDPHHWFLVRSRGRDVGCLLLADHPDLDQVELVYMGVVPEARGRGLGKRLTEQAKRHTLQAGRPRLVLGVDADNGPALLGYTAAGFQCCGEHYVFLRSLRT